MQFLMLKINLSRFFGFTSIAAVCITLQACGSSNDNGGTPPVSDPPLLEVTVTTEQVFSSLPALAQPLAMVQAPGDNSRWFVVERAGRVLVFDNREDVGGSDVFVDIRDVVESGPGESGLLGLAFHPEFDVNGQVYLSYTRPGLISYISRFNSFDGGHTLDPGSEVVVLTVNQDFNNHNGGNIAFGPDGFLYIGFGDGGSANDPLMRAQDTDNVLGAMLRIRQREENAPFC